MFEEPNRQPAGYPIRIGFQTYSLYNASRCFISSLRPEPNTYSVIFSNISLSTPVTYNTPLHPSDGNAYLDVYVISEVCNVLYFIGRTTSRLDTPILHASHKFNTTFHDNLTLCGHTTPLVFKIPDYLLPSGCYIFMISRRDNRCFRTVNPIPWYVPITNVFGFQSPTPHQRLVNSPQVTDHCRELHTSLHDLHGLEDDEVPLSQDVVDDKMMPSIVDKIGVHHTDGRYIPPEQYEYDKKVHKFFFHLFRNHYTRKRTDPLITDFLKTWNHLETRIFYKTMTSPDKFILYIEKKYLSYPSGRLIHPFMDVSSDILWRPAIIVIFDNVLSAKFEDATQTRFSEDAFYKTFFDTSSFEPGKYIPSTASCVIFDTISKTVLSDRTAYIIKIFRRLTTYDESEDPVKHILDTLHNSIN